MQDTELYRQILGLPEPWYVDQVQLDVEEHSVHIFVEYAPEKAVWECPDCGKVCPIYDHREPRKWRHLDSCQFLTYLVASLPRVHCPQHGVQTVSVLWSEQNSRFTHLFERFALDVLRATKVQSQAARLLRLSAGQVHDLMQRGVARGLSRRNREEVVPHLSLDEKSFKKGHQYITVLSDPGRKRVLEVVQERTLEAAQSLLESSLAASQREAVRSVSMDMWPAFLASREAVLPKADTVHDRFHVAAYLNEAVDKTRRSEHKTLSQKKDTTLSRSKYLWLKAPENMTDKQKMAFATLSGLELETAKVWAFKENFRQFFACHTEYGARSFFNRWYEAALVLDNPHLSKVAEMLHRHLEGLLAYVRHRVTNGIAEGLNGQIQLIKASARGFRQFGNFRVAILFFLGKLDMYPHKSP
jgi:transposase